MNVHWYPLGIVLITPPPTPVLPGSSASMVQGLAPQVSLKTARQPVVVSAKGLNQGFVVGAEALQRP